jgi:ABC-type multidrug transport system permease subunit
MASSSGFTAQNLRRGFFFARRGEAAGRGAEAAQSAGFVAIFPLVFASSVFVPVSSMPPWLEAFAKISPVTLTADAARAFALGGSTSDSLPGA